MSRPREPWTAADDRALRREFARGARAAANVASDYDALTAFDHRLGDCILAKLNLRAHRPRRNRNKLEHPNDAFTRGFVAGVAEMHRQLIADGDNPAVQAAIRGAALSMDAMREAGVPELDLRRLRRAGVR